MLYWLFINDLRKSKSKILLTHITIRSSWSNLIDYIFFDICLNLSTSIPSGYWVRVCPVMWSQSNIEHWVLHPQVIINKIFFPHLSEYIFHGYRSRDIIEIFWFRVLTLFEGREHTVASQPNMKFLLSLHLLAWGWCL